MAETDPTLLLEPIGMDDGLGDSDGDEPSNGRPLAKKRKGKSTRWKIPAQALGMLEQVFLVDKFPSVETRKQLAANLKVTPRQVQVWFQNKRQRAVRPKSPDPSGALNSTDDVRAAMGLQPGGSGLHPHPRGAVDPTLQQRDVFADEAAMSSDGLNAAHHMGLGSLAAMGMGGAGSLADAWMAAAAMQARQLREMADPENSGLSSALLAQLTGAASDPTGQQGAANAAGLNQLASLWGLAAGMPGMPGLGQGVAGMPPAPPGPNGALPSSSVTASGSSAANNNNPQAGCGSSSSGCGPMHTNGGWPAGWPSLALPAQGANNPPPPPMSASTAAASSAAMNQQASGGGGGGSGNGNGGSGVSSTLGLPLSQLGGGGDPSKPPNQQPPDMSALLAQASAAAAASLGGAPGGGGPAVGLPNLPDPTSQANMLEQAQQWSDTMSRLTPRELAMLLPQGILAGALPGGGGVKQLAPTVANPAPPTTTAASTTGQPTPAQAVAVGAGGERQRSPRVRGGRTADETAVLADSVVKAEAAQPGGGSTTAATTTTTTQAGSDPSPQQSRPATLLDAANLQAYLAAQQGTTATPFAVTASAAAPAASAAPSGLLQGVPMSRVASHMSADGSQHGVQTDSRTPSCSDLAAASNAAAAAAAASSSSTQQQQQTAQQQMAATVAQMAQSMAVGMAGLPQGVAHGSHTPLPPASAANMMMMDERWQRAMLASQDWTNMLRMANLNPEIAKAMSATTASMQGIAGGAQGLNAATFANLAAMGGAGALGGLGGLPGFGAAGMCGGVGGPCGQPPNTGDTQQSSMNSAPFQQHHVSGGMNRTASEQLLAELTNSTRAQQRQRIGGVHPLLAAQQHSTSQTSADGSMDELIDSLFPFSDDMHQQLGQFGGMGTGLGPSSSSSSGRSHSGSGHRSSHHSSKSERREKRSGRHAISKSSSGGLDSAAVSAAAASTDHQATASTLPPDLVDEKKDGKGSNPSSNHGDGSERATASADTNSRDSDNGSDSGGDASGGGGSGSDSERPKGSVSPAQSSNSYAAARIAQARTHAHTLHIPSSFSLALTLCHPHPHPSSSQGSERD